MGKAAWFMYASHLLLEFKYFCPYPKMTISVSHNAKLRINANITDSGDQSGKPESLDNTNKYNGK